MRLKDDETYYCDLLLLQQLLSAKSQVSGEFIFQQEFNVRIFMKTTTKKSFSDFYQLILQVAKLLFLQLCVRAGPASQRTMHGSFHTLVGLFHKAV